MFSRLGRIARFFEDGLLVTLLVTLSVVAAGQIVLRNVFGFGFVWTDELLKILVLWLALAGGVVASREDRQIRIDLLARVLPPQAERFVAVVVALFTFAVSAMLAWHTARFVLDAREFGDTVLGGFPAWIAQSVMPAGFAVIAFRYLLHLMKHVRALLTPQ